METRCGFELRHLVKLFGASPRQVGQWVSRGLFVDYKPDSLIPESSVIGFIHHHPSEFSLKSVHQEWFTSLVFGNLKGNH